MTMPMRRLPARAAALLGLLAHRHLLPAPGAAHAARETAAAGHWRDVSGNVNVVAAKLKAAGALDVKHVRIEGGQHGVAYMDSLRITRPAMDSFFARTLRPARGN